MAISIDLNHCGAGNYKVFWFKVIVSAFLIAGISELGKRSTAAGAILASLPLVSVLGIVWLYLDTRDETKVISLSYGIFWAVLPSLVFFLVLPLLLKWRVNFWMALPLAIVVLTGAYAVYVELLKRFDVRL